MGTRKPSKTAARKSKKLALNKKTLRDLSPRKGKGDAVRGGRASLHINCG